MDWQPISTAPKDGTPLLLLSQAGRGLAPCTWSPPGEISEDGFWLWWQDEPAWFTEVHNPTHFARIPEPPNT